MRQAIGFADLEAIGDWTGTRRLELQRSAVTDTGLTHLRGLAALEHLDLSDSRGLGRTWAGFAHLGARSGLRLPPPPWQQARRLHPAAARSAPRGRQARRARRGQGARAERRTAERRTRRRHPDRRTAAPRLKAAAECSERLQNGCSRDSAAELPVAHHRLQQAGARGVGIWRRGGRELESARLPGCDQFSEGRSKSQRPTHSCPRSPACDSLVIVRSYALPFHAEFRGVRRGSAPDSRALAPTLHWATQTWSGPSAHWLLGASPVRRGDSPTMDGALSAITMWCCFAATRLLTRARTAPSSSSEYRAAMNALVSVHSFKCPASHKSTVSSTSRRALVPKRSHRDHARQASGASHAGRAITFP